MRRDIDALMERLERVKLSRTLEPEPDALSVSLWQFYDGLEPGELERMGASLVSD